MKLIRIFNPKKKPGPAPGTRTDQQIEQRIMTFIEKHGSGAPTPISLATGIPRWTIQSAMLKMREAKKLVRDGRGKGATYRKA